jgi:hypothetical protein
VNDLIAKVVESSGYIGACSTSKGLNIPTKGDLFRLLRNEVGRGLSITQFKVLLTDGVRGYSWISKLFNKMTKKRINWEKYL